MSKLSEKQIVKLKVRFGERLREVRAASGLTQLELSQKTGITQSQISQFEAGDKDPLFSSVLRLAAGMGVDASVLLQYPGASVNGEDRKR